MAGAGFHLRSSLCRVLVQMCKTKAFRELCTPSPDLSQMVSTALKVLGVSPPQPLQGGILWVSLSFHPLPNAHASANPHGSPWHGKYSPLFNLVAPACGSHHRFSPHPGGREGEGGDRAGCAPPASLPSHQHSSLAVRHNGVVSHAEATPQAHGEGQFPSLSL